MSVVKAAATRQAKQPWSLLEPDIEMEDVKEGPFGADFTKLSYASIRLQVFELCDETAGFIHFQIDGLSL